MHLTCRLWDQHHCLRGLDKRVIYSTIVLVMNRVSRRQSGRSVTMLTIRSLGALSSAAAARSVAMTRLGIMSLSAGDSKPSHALANGGGNL